MAWDVARVAADYEVFYLVDGGDCWLGAQTAGGFADALVAIVGVDHDVYPVLPRIADDDGSDIGDFHLDSSLRSE